MNGPKEFFEIPVKNNQLTIPLDLLAYAQKNSLVKPLRIYIYLKCTSDGIINEYSDSFKNMPSHLGIKSKRCIQKYLNQLRELKWVGYDITTRIFYIRSLVNVFRICGLECGQAIVFDFLWIGKFREFVDAALVARQINKIKYRMRKERSEPATKMSANRTRNSRVAKQGSLLLLHEGLDYTGISLMTLATLFHCGKSNAVKRKKAAIRAKFLSFKKKWMRFKLLDEPDYNLRKIMVDNHPQLKGRIRFRWVSVMERKTRKFVRRIEVSIQRVDEASHTFTFKQVKHLVND